MCQFYFRKRNFAITLLHSNQIKINQKLTKGITLFSKITDKLFEELYQLELNQNSTIGVIQKFFTRNEQLYAIQILRDSLKSFENQIDILTRTVIFANNDTPNLEIITLDELDEIHIKLLRDYGADTLMPYDKIHPFEILQSTKFGIVGINGGGFKNPCT